MNQIACVVRHTAVHTIQLAPASGSVAAFAIDSPRAGETAPGTGLELNGWAIGSTAPLRGIRTVVNGEPGDVIPLDVPRLDVAADYPAFAHAAASGFSFWAPLPPDPGPWRLTIDALANDGTWFTLAEFDGDSTAEHRQPGPGTRPVCAPDFAIIGAQRGGTTSLHAYLNAHPLVVTPLKKELHFLTDRHQHGRDWYLGQFPPTVPSSAITGEATPYALFHPQSPRRLHAVAPHARLIVLLRNPVDRAYSHYLLERSRGDELLSFADALDAEPLRLAGEARRLAADPRAISAAHNHASYLARGHYAPQLARWLDLFPREQLLILRSEDLYANPGTSLTRVTNFLGLPPSAGVPFTRHNQTSGPSLDPSLRDHLAHYFAPRNAELADLLDWDPGWQ